MTDLASRRARWFDTVWYQTASLGVVTLIAAAALAVANIATGPAIETARARDLAASLEQVLPAGSFDNDLLTDVVLIDRPDGRLLKLHVARRDGVPFAVVFETIGRGYAGPIHVVMGVDHSGTVTGVRVTRHSETPGLGDKIEVQRDPWIHSFVDRALDDGHTRWAVRKDGGDFDQFAGATITPRAVVNAVREGLAWHASFRADVFDRPPVDRPPALPQLETSQ